MCNLLKSFCHTSSWLTSILPFLFISRIKLQMDFFISLWTDMRFWSTWRSLKNIHHNNESFRFDKLYAKSNSTYINTFWRHLSITWGCILKQLTNCSCSWHSEVIWKLDIQYVILRCMEIHTHCLWSLRLLQSVSFFPVADGSCSACALCGFYKHLPGTGN